MMLKYIEIRGSNLIQGFCFSPVESHVPEHVVSEVNISDDSWISAESEFVPAREPLDSSGDSIYTDTCEQFLSSGDDSDSSA